MAAGPKHLKLFIVTYLHVTVLSLKSFSDATDVTWDENGYILYCPCMGNDGMMHASSFIERHRDKTPVSVCVVLE